MRVFLYGLLAFSMLCLTAATAFMLIINWFFSGWPVIIFWGVSFLASIFLFWLFFNMTILQARKIQ